MKIVDTLAHYESLIDEENDSFWDPISRDDENVIRHITICSRTPHMLLRYVPL